jgi:hypothetical protein
MANQALKDCEKDYFLLLEAGFVAVNQTDEDSAMKLFMACQALRPKNVFPEIGFGYMHMCKLELKQAEEMFLKVLEKESNNEMAHAFLGICKSMIPGKTSEGEKILDTIDKATQDADIKELVSRSHEFIDNFVKKESSSPMDLAKPKKKTKDK